jgi:hypothetical protein
MKSIFLALGEVHLLWSWVTTSVLLSWACTYVLCNLELMLYVYNNRMAFITNTSQNSISTS